MSARERKGGRKLDLEVKKKAESKEKETKERYLHSLGGGNCANVGGTIVYTLWVTLQMFELLLDRR